MGKKGKKNLWRIILKTHKSNFHFDIINIISYFAKLHSFLKIFNYPKYEEASGIL